MQRPLVLFLGLVVTGIVYPLWRFKALYFPQSLSAALSFLFLFSVWTGRPLPRKWFLILVVLLSLAQTAPIFDPKNLHSLLIHDDHPKFFSFTRENAALLMRYGTPFGFNHDFQGGIPTVYFRSCFLEFIPFSLLFGPRAGYQLMLVFFIAGIPVALYFLARGLTRREDIAQAYSFLSAFPFVIWPSLWPGIAPMNVATPILIFSLLFFLKYLYETRGPVFPLLLTNGLLLYTHTAAFFISWILFLLFWGYKCVRDRTVSPADLKKLSVLVLLVLVLSAPLCVNLLVLSHFLTTEWQFPPPMSWAARILSVFANLRQEADLRDPLFLSLFCLPVFYLLPVQPSGRPLLRRALLFSAVILFLLALYNLPLLRVLLLRFDAHFAGYVALFNLTLFLLFRINPKFKALGVLLLVLLFHHQYLLGVRSLPSVKSVKGIDGRIKSFVRPGDVLLIEHCCFFNPSKDEAPFDECPGGYGHWTTYLQRNLHVKLFAHMGEDPHPYNTYRDMYIVNGFYNGERLGKKTEKDFIAQLRDWNVNKACVWSPTADRFFRESEDFKFLGRSDKYACFEATYGIGPGVRLPNGGTGRITAEKPFSFTVDLTRIPGPETATVNKNYFRFWSAVDENGRAVPLKRCGRKICFDADHDGRVFFRYRKNLLWNLLALLSLPAAFLWDRRRPASPV